MSSAAGEVQTAQDYLQESLNLARELDHSVLEATILNNLGNLLGSQGDDLKALQHYQESASLAQARSSWALAGRSRVNAAMAAVRLARYAEAEVLLGQALTLVGRATPSHDQAYDLINIGLVYRDLRQHLAARLRDRLLLRAADALNAAMGIAQRLKDSLAMSYASGYLGGLYEEEQRYDEALRLTRRALLAAQHVNAPESTYRWEWQTGRLLRAQNRFDAALQAYRRAVKTLQSFRQEFRVQTPTTPSFRAVVGPVYFELVDLLFQKAAGQSDSLTTEPLLLEARETVELFKAAELQDYFQDNCVDAAQQVKTPLDRISQTAIVIYPILLKDWLELLISLPAGLKHVTIQVDRATLTREVRAFRKTLEKRTTHQYRPHAQRLYDWLIRPLESDLEAAKAKILVFVPDGPLPTIPMAALLDDREFLISKYAIATTPGLNLTDPQPLPEDKRALALGLTAGVQNFPPLPYVEQELAALKRLYPNVTLMNDQFNLSNMEKELKQEPFSMLHIASHGQFGSTVEETFLLTFDDKLTMDRLDAMLGLFRFRDTPLEMLVLSACETAAGDDRAALGLAGVAIKAGARSALATLWFVNDQASSVLVTEFYRNLKTPTLPRALALQRAQLSLLASRLYHHPAYWAPFLLLNNWL